MSYTSWLKQHTQKHQKIIQKLLDKNYSQEQIIEYFDFDNMKQKEPEFCPLYAKDKKCHDMKELNCYICACPNFRFNEEGLGEYDSHPILSKCAINNGSTIASKKDGAIHQNCTNCTVPHHKSFVEKHFSLDLKEILQKCSV